MKKGRKLIFVAATTIALLCYAITAYAVTPSNYNWDTQSNNSVESALFQYPYAGTATISYYCSYSSTYSSANAGLMKVVKWAPDVQVSVCTNMTAGTRGYDTVSVDYSNSNGVRQSYYWRISGYETKGNCRTDIY